MRAGNIHGLRPDQTLVLINSRRVHTTAVFAAEGGSGLYTAPFDFNTVPTNAIKRIELLADGAGAQYGSDAIAGVINIILDDRPKGGQLSVDYGQRHSYFAPIDRTLNDGRTLHFNADYGVPVGDGGHLRFGAEALFRGATNRAGYSQSEDGVRGPIPWEADPGQPNSVRNDIAAAAGRVMTAGDGLSQGGSAFCDAGVPLNENWTLNSFATLSYRYTEGAAFFRWPADYGGDGPTGNRNPGAIYHDGYRPVTQGHNLDFRVSTGVKGKVAGWATDLSVTTGQSDFLFDVRNSLNPSFGDHSPRQFHLYRAGFGQTTVNIDANRTFDPGLAKPLLVAWGGEYRHERFATYPGDPLSWQQGPLPNPIGAQAGPGLSPRDAGRANRNVLGGYAEVTLTPITALTFDAAGRYEHYDDFGNTLNGKIAARLQVSPWLAIRGTLSSNYRAPSLAQLVTQISTLAFDPAGGGLLTQVTASPDGPIAKALGFPALRPERSRNISLGPVIALPGFNASFSYFDIHLRDAIGISPTISGDRVSAYLLGRTGRFVESVQLLQNIDAYTRRGFDVSASYTHRVGDGRLGLTGAYTQGKSVPSNADFVIPATLTELGYQPPAFQSPVYRFITRKLVLTPRYSDDATDISVRFTRFGQEYLPIIFTDDFQRLPAKWTVDLSVGRDVARNLRLEAGGQNILNTYLQRQAYPNTYYGTLPYNGQMYFLGAYYYLRLQVKL